TRSKLLTALVSVTTLPDPISVQLHNSKAIAAIGSIKYLFIGWLLFTLGHEDDALGAGHFILHLKHVDDSSIATLQLCVIYRVRLHYVLRYATSKVSDSNASRLVLVSPLHGYCRRCRRPARVGAAPGSGRPLRRAGA